jgi:hypothetical protein
VVDGSIQVMDRPVHCRPALVDHVYEINAKTSWPLGHGLFVVFEIIGHLPFVMQLKTGVC